MHAAALSDGALGIFHSLVQLGYNFAPYDISTYFILYERERHAVAVTTNLNIACAELGEGNLHMVFELIVGLGLRQAIRC